MYNDLRYFSKSEFNSPDIDDSYMNFRFLLMLDSLREKCGFPLKINSGYRTEDYNRKIGGVENSNHCLGIAADIHCVDSIKRYQIIKNALEIGFTRIGIYENFIHLDMGEEEFIWL